MPLKGCLYALRRGAWMALVALGLCLAQGTPALSACRADSVKLLLEDLRLAWEGLRAYEAQVDVRVTMPDQSRHVRRFQYSFIKPDHIHIRMEEPYGGTVLIYPDENGRVAVHFPGLLSLFRLSLKTDNVFFTSLGGQPIDQTDLGHLVQNIFRSLTNESQGGVGIEETDHQIVVKASATHHFFKGVVTAFTFVIDKNLCLPVEVQESPPANYPARSIILRDLKVDSG